MNEIQINTFANSSQVIEDLVEVQRSDEFNFKKV
jgi:hypothetical protein